MMMVIITTTTRKQLLSPTVDPQNDDEFLMVFSFDSGDDAKEALENLKAFADGGIDSVTVSESRGGYIFEVCV